MNLKRPLKLSARCCQTTAKIFLAPFIRASNSIPVPTKTLHADLRLVVRCSSYEVVTEECILSYYPGTLIILTIGDFVFVNHYPFKLTVGASCQEATLWCAI